MEMTRWMMQDPSKIIDYKRHLERQEAKFESGLSPRERLEQLFNGDPMTLDESEQVEELLVIWYDYEASYRPALGAPRISPSCRGYIGGEEGYSDSDELDETLNKSTAEAVAVCVDGLELMQRAAIQVHMRNKYVKASVHKHPRIEDQHIAYKEAKEALLDKLKIKGLIK